MTDKLNAAMHREADTTDFPAIDLDAVIAGGARRVRRRRTAWAAGAATGAVALVALVITLTQPGTVRAEIEPADPFPTSVRSLDPVITAGNRIIVLGQPETVVKGAIVRLVRTRDTSVYVTDPDEFDKQPGEVHALDGGAPVDLGTGYDLAADADGHVAAWLRADADATRLIVLDTRTLATTETALEAAGGRARVRLRDVEGRTAYVHDGRGEVALDLVDGSTQSIDGVLVDAENGVLVLPDPTPPATTASASWPRTPRTPARRHPFPGHRAGHCLQTGASS